LIAKIVNAHGEARPELSKVQHEFAALRSELEPHMFKEEQVLFPAIRWLEQSETQPAFPFGTVANPIRMMEHEHDTAGNVLARIRELTCDYRAPADACNTYRAALDGLRELEIDLHQHIHKENSILFPKAIERETSLCDRQESPADRS
jgi:regulator of cell morphogenesis and NO signaling